MKTEVKGTIFDWETVKEYLYPVLLPLKTAQKMDSTTARVYRKWLDIAIAYAVRMVDETNKLVDHINVRQSLLIMWGVDEETLYQQAMKNLYKEQYEVKKLWDVLMELSKKTSELPEIECPADVDILILSNSYLSYGAAGMLLKEKMKQISAEMGGKDLYILPSSVHEILLLVENKELKEYINETIQEINNTQVEEKDRLANHVYLYNHETGEITY